MDEKLKKLLFKRCLKLEAEAATAKHDPRDTMAGIVTASGAKVLRELIDDAGLYEEYRSFYYGLALRAAGEVLRDRD